MDILSKDTENLIKNKNVRKIVHELLEAESGTEKVIEVNGRKITLTRV